MDPSAPKSMGFKTLHLSKNEGRKNKGIQIQEHIHKVQLSFSKQHADIFYKRRDLGIIFGLMHYYQLLMMPNYISFCKTFPYFCESKGWNFSIPQKEMLQFGWQTILEVRAQLYLTCFSGSFCFAHKLQMSQVIRGYRAIQLIGMGQYWGLLYIKVQIKPAKPERKQIPSTISYIYLQKVLYSTGNMPKIYKNKLLRKRINNQGGQIIHYLYLLEKEFEGWKQSTDSGNRTRVPICQEKKGKTKNLVNQIKRTGCHLMLFDVYLNLDINLYQIELRKWNQNMNVNERKQDKCSLIIIY